MTEARLQEIRAELHQVQEGLSWTDDDVSRAEARLAPAVDELLDEVARLRVLYEAMREAARAVHTRTQVRIGSLFRNLSHVCGGSLDGMTTRDLLGLLEVYGIADSSTGDEVLAAGVPAEGEALVTMRVDLYQGEGREAVEERIAAVLDRLYGVRGEEEGVELAASAAAARANLERFAPCVEDAFPAEMTEADMTRSWEFGDEDANAVVHIDYTPYMIPIGAIMTARAARWKAAAKRARRARRPEGSQP